MLTLCHRTGSTSSKFLEGQVADDLDFVLLVRVLERWYQSIEVIEDVDLVQVRLGNREKTLVGRLSKRERNASNLSSLNAGCDCRVLPDGLEVRHQLYV